MHLFGTGKRIISIFRKMSPDISHNSVFSGSVSLSVLAGGNAISALGG